MRLKIAKNIGMVLPLLSVMATAEPQTQSEQLLKSIEFHGFASQSMIHTDHNSYFGDSQNSSFEFRELGLNAQWQASSNLRIALQLVSRDAGATDDNKIRVDYGFIDYHININPKLTAGLRLGRVINPYGLYNDTRDVAATRPSILLPQSIYFDVNRNLALSSDGGLFYFNTVSSIGDFNFEVVQAKPRSRDPDLEPALFGSQLPGGLEGDSSWLARLSYEYDLGRIRLGINAANIKLDYVPGNTDPVAGASVGFKPIIFSAQYNAENWSLTSEYVRRTVSQQIDLVSPMASIQGKNTGRGYFVQYNRRIKSNWQAFIRYDELIWDNKDKKGIRFAQLTGRPAHSRFAKDWTLGLRWDMNQNLSFNAEWHRIDGTGWLSALENTPLSSTHQTWNLLALSASIRF